MDTCPGISRLLKGQLHRLCSSPPSLALCLGIEGLKEYERWGKEVAKNLSALEHFVGAEAVRADVDVNRWVCQASAVLYPIAQREWMDWGKRVMPWLEEETAVEDLLGDFQEQPSPRIVGRGTCLEAEKTLVVEARGAGLATMVLRLLRGGVEDEGGRRIPTRQTFSSLPSPAPSNKTPPP